jgi:hypothetical protein
MGEHLGRRAFLHHPAEIEHHHPVAQAADDVQIMANEKQAQMQPRAQIGQQRQHLGLHRDIECRDRLIRHQQVRCCRQGAGDADALALAAAELMRVAPGILRRQPNLREQRRHPPGPFG